MKRWFNSLPIHRKLIALVLAVSGVALAAAVLGLLLFDVLRFRQTAVADADGVAQVIAENAAAVIVFDVPEEGARILASAHVRPVISHVCLYRTDGSLFAAYERSTDRPCPATPVAAIGWQAVSTHVPVVRNDIVVGNVYVERTLDDLGARLLVTAAAGGLMLLIAAVIAFGLAQRLQRVISRPIVSLVQAARIIGRNEPYDVKTIPAAPDEIGDLVRAFDDMVQRLLASNAALRAEVDERRRMQAERETLLTREREASRLKDEFLAAVSHELRTPLNAILGWTQILATTEPSQETIAKAVTSLSRNAQAQNRVIEDLIDVSRIVTGKLQLARHAIDLRSVVESAVEVVKPVAAAKQILLTVDVPQEASVVHGDADRLQQVVWNLLSNAVKFTAAGGSVRIQLTDEGRSWSLAVSDTGIGMSPDFVPHAFERFRQADGSMKREHSGLGLGLAIVKELTELHAGTVQAASAGPGRGSIFTVTVPKAVGGTSEAGAGGKHEMPEPGRLDGISVLAVDDNADARDIVMETLTHAGATVHAASSGAEALEQFPKMPPDVVLCDLAMPGMDGFEFLQQLRQIDRAEGRRTPVIAVSAYASEEYRSRSLRAGFQDHLAKPYSTVDLVQTVAAAALTSSVPSAAEL